MVIIKPSMSIDDAIKTLSQGNVDAEAILSVVVNSIPSVQRQYRILALCGTHGVIGAVADNLYTVCSDKSSLFVLLLVLKETMGKENAKYNFDFTSLTSQRACGEFKRTIQQNSFLQLASTLVLTD